MMDPMLKQVTEWTAWTLNPEAMQAQDVWYCDKEHQVLKKLLPDQWRTASMVLVSSCIYHVLEVWCTCMLNLPTCPLIFSRDKQEAGCKLRVSATDEHPRLLKSSNAVFRVVTACDTKMKIKLDFVWFCHVACFPACIVKYCEYVDLTAPSTWLQT